MGVTPDHISLNISTEEINDPQYSEIRKRAAEEFLEKELKITTTEIKFSKLSNTSPILWIEVQDSDTVDSIIRQSTYFKRDAKAIMYPPPKNYSQQLNQ